MRFDFSRFLLEVEHRFRWFRGLSLACRLLFYGSIACVAVSLGLRWLIPNLALGLALLALLIPISLTAGAFLLGWWKRPNLPHLLLQLDDKLDSGARISSLYEVRTRGHASIIRVQLESLVESISTDWKRGITLPPRTLGFLSAGIAGVLVACVILAFPISLPAAVSSEPPVQSEASATQMRISSLTEASQDNARTTLDEVSSPLVLSEEAAFSQRDPTEEVTQTRPNEDLSLDSILDDLSMLSRGEAQVDAPPTSEELLDLAEAQEQARQALFEMLMDLQERMQNNPRPLTQQESQSLQDQAAQTGDSEIEQQTDDLVNEPNPDQIGEKLQDLIEKVDPDSVEPETSPESGEENGDGSGHETPQSTEIAGDQEAGQRFLERTAQQLEEQANAETEQDGDSQRLPSSQDKDDTQDTGEDGSTDIRMAGDPDDLSQTGGEEGIGGISDDDPAPGEVGFIREEAPSTIGAEGGFINEFVTKGVPVEIASSETKAGTHIIDFERMESILHERGLPEEALDSVRRYFELITRPEGGS
ncbi:hypothetical protein KAR02_04435 [Candidatus Bipolaricaulota bacterium]|nr:hypothetical protein [Candidatus Bipolaricaulota bacterium]